MMTISFLKLDLTFEWKLGDMAKLTLEEIKQTKILIGQLKALCSSITDSLYNEKSVEHSRYFIFKSAASIYNGIAEKAVKLCNLTVYRFNTENMQSSTSTIWPIQKEILEEVLLLARQLLVTLESNFDFIDDEFDNLSNFIQSRFRSIVFEEPKNEIDIQNHFEALLVGHGMNKGVDYNRETGKIEFSGKEFIPDFILPKLNLSVEIKFLRDKNKKSKIIEEISADITAYRKEYSRQLFIVYDLGIIQNEYEFKHDIEALGNIKIIIIKH